MCRLDSQNFHRYLSKPPQNDRLDNPEQGRRQKFARSFGESSCILGENDLNSEKGGIHVSPPDRYVPNSSPANFEILGGMLSLSFLRALPQLYDFHSARWVAITSIFFFAVSNGWLSTVCYTRAPKMLPPSLPSIVAEQASAVCALGS